MNAEQFAVTLFRATNRMLAGSVLWDPYEHLASVTGLDDFVTLQGVRRHSGRTVPAGCDWVLCEPDEIEALLGVHDDLWRAPEVAPVLLVTTRPYDADRLAASLNATLVSGTRPGLNELENARGERAVVLLVDSAAASEQRTFPEIVGDAPARIAWVKRHLTVTAAMLRNIEELIRGRRILINLVLEPKTAAFIELLQSHGADIAVFGAANETDPSVAAELAERGVPIFAPQSAIDRERWAETDRTNAREALAWGAEMIIDDGAHLIRLAHEAPGKDRALATHELIGAAEETTSGVRPLKVMEAAGALRIPVIAANDARTKALFDNRVGTGESCVLTTAGWCAGSAEGRRWTVYGYGPVGQGVARTARALGARVTVAEIDPVQILTARVDGFESVSAADHSDALRAALADTDVLISATGVPGTLHESVLCGLKAGACVSVAGGVDGELALDDLADAGWSSEADGAYTARWTSTDGQHTVRVLASGWGVNYTAGEGNPIQVMDLSFATQVRSIKRLIDLAGQLEPGVHLVGSDAEHDIAWLAAGEERPATELEDAAHDAESWQTHRFR